MLVLVLGGWVWFFWGWGMFVVIRFSVGDDEGDDVGDDCEEYLVVWSCCETSYDTCGQCLVFVASGCVFAKCRTRVVAC